MKNFIKIAVVVVVALSSSLYAQRITDKAISTIEQAMNDELGRSKEKLRLSGLTNPFYVSYIVNDNTRLDIGASFGAITRSQETRGRAFSLRLMVGDYHMNDENFDGGGGGLFGGGGPHFCMGNFVAKMQLREIFDQLLHRVPTLELGEPEYLVGNFVHAVKSMPYRIR